MHKKPGQGRSVVGVKVSNRLLQASYDANSDIVHSKNYFKKDHKIKTKLHVPSRPPYRAKIYTSGLTGRVSKINEYF